MTNVLRNVAETYINEVLNIKEGLSMKMRKIEDKLQDYHDEKYKDKDITIPWPTVKKDIGLTPQDVKKWELSGSGADVVYYVGHQTDGLRLYDPANV